MQGREGREQAAGGIPMERWWATYRNAVEGAPLPRDHLSLALVPSLRMEPGMNAVPLRSLSSVATQTVDLPMNLSAANCRFSRRAHGAQP